MIILLWQWLSCCFATCKLLPTPPWSGDSEKRKLFKKSPHEQMFVIAIVSWPVQSYWLIKINKTGANEFHVLWQDLPETPTDPATDVSMHRFKLSVWCFNQCEHFELIHIRSHTPTVWECRCSINGCPGFQPRTISKIQDQLLTETRRLLNLGSPHTCNDVLQFSLALTKDLDLVHSHLMVALWGPWMS